MRIEIRARAAPFTSFSCRLRAAELRVHLRLHVGRHAFDVAIEVEVEERRGGEEHERHYEPHDRERLRRRLVGRVLHAHALEDLGDAEVHDEHPVDVEVRDEHEAERAARRDVLLPHARVALLRRDPRPELVEPHHVHDAVREEQQVPEPEAAAAERHQHSARVALGADRRAGDEEAEAGEHRDRLHDAEHQLRSAEARPRQRRAARARRDEEVLPVVRRRAGGLLIRMRCGRRLLIRLHIPQNSRAPAEGDPSRGSRVGEAPRHQVGIAWRPQSHESGFFPRSFRLTSITKVSTTR